MASTVADQVVDYICNFGVMDKLLSDQGTNYESQLIAELMDTFDIHKIRTTSFRPQTDGITERANQTIKNMIMNYVNDDQDNWDLHLNTISFAYNTAVHKSTSYTPFELMFNRKPKLPIDIFYPALNERDILNENINVDFNFKEDSYAKETKNKFETIFKIVKQNTQMSMNKAKIRYDRDSRACNFKEGDLVLMNDFTRKKLEPRWNGPWIIVKKTNEINYILRSTHLKRKKDTICHQNRLKRWHGSAQVSADFKTKKVRNSKNNKTTEIEEDEQLAPNVSQVAQINTPIKNTPRKKQKKQTQQTTEHTTNAQPTTYQKDPTIEGENQLQSTVNHEYSLRRKKNINYKE